MTSDAGQMARALALAERGRGTTSPNPMVGAVIVDDEGVIVGRGSHAVAGGPHAEIVAFAEAGEKARGGTLYCTLEPCSHTGRTGPCAPRVVAAGIRRAVLAMTDPNPLVSGRGIGLLRQHGIEVSVGLMEAEARRLNAPFLTRIERHRPHVTMKIALSADGRVALPGGQSIRITADVADRHIQRDRAEVDAIGVGSGTLLLDDPRLTARGAFRRRPLVRVIFDRRLRTPPSARVLSTLTCGPVIIETAAESVTDMPARAAALSSAGATMHALGDSGAAFLATALRELAAAGVSSVMLEGGPALHRAFWDAGLVDRVQLYVGRISIGPNGVPWWSEAEAVSAALEDVRIVQLGPDRLIEGDVHRTD